MKNNFLASLVLLSFVIVSTGVPLPVSAVNTGAEYNIEESLSDMDPWADVAGIALTCAASHAITTTVIPAVSGAMGSIAELFGLAEKTTGATVETTAESTALAAATAAATTAEAGATAVAAGTLAEALLLVPTQNPVLQGGLADQLIVAGADISLNAASAAAKTPKEVEAKKTDGVFDCIVYNAGQQMLQQLTDNTVKWIQGGFHGSPSFTVNTHEVFLDLADMVAGDLARELRGVAMCDFGVNFQNDLSNTIELSAKKTYKFAGAAKCPFPETFNVNSSDFYTGINKFSWGAMEYAMKDNGNPFGMALLTGEELERRSSEKKEVRKQELSWSNGFTNIVDTDNCQYRSTILGRYDTNEDGQITKDEWETLIADGDISKNEAREYQKEACKTTTPGKMLGDQLSDITRVDMQRLGMVDNINKIVGAFISQVTKQAALGIFNAVSGQDAELKTNYVTVQKKSSQTMAMENAALKPYFDTWQVEIQKEADAKEELAKIWDELNLWASGNSTITDPASLNQRRAELEAIIAAAPQKIAAAKAAYDDAASAERSVARQEELVAAQAEYDAAQAQYTAASNKLNAAKKAYAEYLSGSLSESTYYVPPDPVTLASYKQAVVDAEDTFFIAKIDFDSASNRLYAAQHPAYVAPLQ